MNLKKYAWLSSKLNSQNSNNQQGFTLVEVMIVTWVVLVVWLIAVPSYRYAMTQINRIEVRAEVVEIVKQLSVLSMKSSDGRLPSGLKLDTKRLIHQANPHYEVSIEIVDSGFGFWVVARPKSSGDQVGDGAQGLGHTGVGCWYTNNDDPAINEPCDTDKYEVW